MSTSVAVPNEELLFMPGYGDVAARHRTIASVHFQHRDYHDFWHSRNRSFRLNPGSMGKPSLLKVWDSQQWNEDTSALIGFQAGMERPEAIPKPVPVEAIVADLLTRWVPYWSRNGKQLARKPDVGIILLAGDIPTPEEIERMNKMETAHCVAMIDEADRFSRNGQGEITDYHRDCLVWTGSERRDWYKKPEPGQVKKSAVTGNWIPMEALADGGQDLQSFYVRNFIDPGEFGDEFVAARWAKNPKIKEGIERQLGMAVEAQTGPVRPPVQEKSK